MVIKILDIFKVFLGIFLTIFYADFGKEFPSRTLWRGPPSNCPSPSSVLCLLLYRTELFSRRRKGRKGAEKRGGRGVASKAGKKEKGRVKIGQFSKSYAAPIGAFFCPEIPAFTGFGARFLQPFPKFFS